MLNPARSGRVLLRAVILVVIVALLCGGGYWGHKYRRQSIARKALVTGKEAYNAKHFTDAATNLGRYLTVDPANVDVLLMYADAQLCRRPRADANLQQAINALELVLRSQPGNRTAAERLLGIYPAIDAKLDAERIARAWVSAAGSNAAAMSDARQHLFAVLMEQKKFDGAWQLISEWLTKAPMDVVALRSKAQWLAANRDTDDKNKAQERIEQAIGVLEKAIKEDPAEVQAVAQLAELLVFRKEGSPEERQKNRATAEEALAKLLEHNPTSVQARLARGQFRLRCLGLARINREDLSGAEQDFDAARQLVIHDAAALVELGRLYAEMGLISKAAATFQAAEAAAPDNVNIYAIASGAVLDAGDANIIGTFVDHALKAPLGEQRVDLLPALIELCTSIDRVPQARTLADEFHAAQPPPALLHFVDAVVDQAEGRLPAAIARLQDAIRLNPKLARAQLRLARLWARTGQSPRAVEPLKACIELTRRDRKFTTAGRLQLELAGLYAELGRWDEAARAAEDAVYPPNPRLSAAAHLGALEFKAKAALRSGPEPDVQALAKIHSQLDEDVKLNPKLLELQLLSARILAWQGRVDEGVAILNRLNGDTATRQSATESLIELYTDAHQYDQAVRTCAEAVKLAEDASKPAMKSRLVELQALAGDVPGARQTLREIETADARQWGAAKLRLAQLMMRGGQTDDARSELVELVGKDPKNITARINLLSIGSGADGKPSQQELVEQIKSIEGEQGRNWRYCQANVWLADGDWAKHRDAAEKLLNECLSADATWDAGAMALAAWYEKAGDDTRALELYQTQLKQSPRNVDIARRALALLVRFQRWVDVEHVLAAFPPAELALQDYRLELMQRTGDREDAGRLLTKRVQENSQDYQACLQLMALNLEKDDLPEAERLLGKAAQIRPTAREVLRARIQLHLRKQELDQALEAATQWLAKDPNSDGYQFRAQVYEAKGDLAKAEQDLRAIAGLPGEAGRGYLALGRLYFRHDQRAKAVEIWREGLKLLPESYPLQRAVAEALLGDPNPKQQQAGLAWLTDMLKKNPKDEALLLMRADQLNRSRQIKEAQQAYEAILSLRPDSAAAFHGLASLALSDGLPDGAARALGIVERGLNANPHDPDLLLLRSNLLGRSNPGRALASAREAALIQPQSEPVALAVANGLVSSGKAEEAMASLKGFLKRSDAGPRARTRLCLAELLIRKGEFQAADALIEEARRLIPDDPVAVQTRLLWHQQQKSWDAIAALASDCLQRPEGRATVQVAAQMLVGSGQAVYEEKGLGLLKQLIQRYPEDPTSYAQLGLIYYVHGKPMEARAAWERAHALDPHPTSNLINDLTWLICEDLKDPAAALEWGKKVMAMAPNDPHALDTWGVLQYRLGKVKESRDALLKCLDSRSITDDTRFSATFHLARTLETLEPQNSWKMLDLLLNDQRVKADQQTPSPRLLSRVSYEEACGLRDKLAAQTQPAS